MLNQVIYHYYGFHLAELLKFDMKKFTTKDTKKNI